MFVPRTPINTSMVPNTPMKPLKQVRAGFSRKRKARENRCRGTLLIS